MHFITLLDLECPVMWIKEMCVSYLVKSYAHMIWSMMTEFTKSFLG